MPRRRRRRYHTSFWSIYQVANERDSMWVHSPAKCLVCGAFRTDQKKFSMRGRCACCDKNCSLSKHYYYYCDWPNAMTKTGTNIGKRKFMRIKISFFFLLLFRPLFSPMSPGTVSKQWFKKWALITTSMVKSYFRMIYVLEFGWMRSNQWHAAIDTRSIFIEMLDSSEWSIRCSCLSIKLQHCTTRQRLRAVAQSQFCYLRIALIPSSWALHCSCRFGIEWPIKLKFLLRRRQMYCFHFGSSFHFSFAREITKKIELLIRNSR